MSSAVIQGGQSLTQLGMVNSQSAQAAAALGKPGQIDNSWISDQQIYTCFEKEIDYSECFV